jgi:DNA-binding transcriptional LysR family regulator
MTGPTRVTARSAWRESKRSEHLETTSRWPRDDPEVGFGYEQWLRGLCKRFGGFEPDIAASVNSFEGLIGMLAGGRGVFVGPELVMRGREESWRSVDDFYLLTEPGSHFEQFAIWKKQSQVEPAISKFIDLLFAELKSP